MNDVRPLYSMRLRIANCFTLLCPSQSASSTSSSCDYGNSNNTNKTPLLSVSFTNNQRQRPVSRNKKEKWRRHDEITLLWVIIKLYLHPDAGCWMLIVEFIWVPALESREACFRCNFRIPRGCADDVPWFDEVANDWRLKMLSVARVGECGLSEVRSLGGSFGLNFRDDFWWLCCVSFWVCLSKNTVLNF